MSTSEIAILMQGSITQILNLIFPVLGSALIVGLIIAIFQATTSIQEQTLTFLPKFLVILLILAIAGGAMFGNLSEYTVRLFSRIPDLSN